MKVNPFRNRRAESAALEILGLTPDEMEVRGNVLAIVTDEESGFQVVRQTHNIVTNSGDEYYAELGAGETATNLFDSLWLGTVASGAPGKASDSDTLTLIASTTKTVKTGYPKTNDADADNTGSGIDVVTWTFEYAAGDFSSSAITDGMIGVGAKGAAEPALTHFEFSGGSFAKAATDTLKVIVNHTFNGV